MSQLIVTADDFGAAPEVNAAVEEAHIGGILTAASLMVGGAAACEAISVATRLPLLRVGLHLVLVDGLPTLPPATIPLLVRPDGTFRNDMTKLALEIFANNKVQQQLSAEITAQFEAFARSGLKLDHVNMHKHFQLHPLVARTVIDIGRNFGMRAMRVPHESQSALRNSGENALFSTFATNAWARPLTARLVRAGMAHCDHVFGLRWSGAMTSRRLLQIIPHLPKGPCELYLHPGTKDSFAGSVGGYRYRDELSALTDPAVIAAIVRSGRHLCGYSELAA